MRTGSRKSYKALIAIDNFVDRFEYLRVPGHIGEETFGYERYLNQMFYTSREWKLLRDEIILRDQGCDLAFPGRIIHGKIIIHHINPITYDDLANKTDAAMDPNNLVCVSHITHNAIHYGDSSILYPDPVERYPNDTCPWKGGRL